MENHAGSLKASGLDFIEMKVYHLIYMLTAAVCFTITSLNDKYASAKLKLSGNEMTFLMALGTSFFMLFYLPFSNNFFTASWHSFATVLAMAFLKFVEIELSVRILREMSAFELKAWLGVSLFLSYTFDLIAGNESFGIHTVYKFAAIVITSVGLFLIAKSGSKTVRYRVILIPLLFYVIEKFSYGLLVNVTQTYISPTFSLFLAFVVLTAFLAPRVRIAKLLREKRKGTSIVFAAKIPNTIGLVCENLTAANSITDYSFIQPIILATLFAIQLIRRETTSKLSIVGGILCVLGIVLFQLI